jgi:mevalonate kinase
MTKAYAPGKIMLMGEHAVVFGQPCLVAAIDKYLGVSLVPTNDNEIHIDAPECGGDTRFILSAIEAGCKEFHIDQKGIHIQTISQISQMGLGSSAAVVVAAIVALAHEYTKDISDKQLFDICYRVVLKVQKLGSGFDVAASVYGGVLYFQNQGKTIELIKTKEPLSIIVGFSGQKASTVSLIEMVAKKQKEYPQKVDRIMEAIGKLVHQAKPALIEGDYETFGKFMNFNHEYLRDLGVSNETLETMILKAKEHGAWGAKLSGAGGGDCMIALGSTSKQNDIVNAIQSVSGNAFVVGVSEKGAQVES